MSLVVLLVFIIVVVPVSLGVLAGIIALLINPRTRVATGVVLVVAPLILLVAAALLWGVTRRVKMAEEHQRAATLQTEIRRLTERTDTPPSGKNPEIQGYYREGVPIQPADGSRYYQEGADIVPRAQAAHAAGGSMNRVALLPVFILVVPVFLGVLAGIIALLINPRTRVAACIVLVVAAPVILLVAAGLSWSSARGERQIAEVQQMEMGRSVERTNTPSSGRIPVEQGYDQEGATIHTLPTHGSSSMSWSFALPVFILIALVSLGVLAGLIALLINPRTRVATGIVLVVAAPVILLVATRLFWGYSLGSLVAPISVSSGDGRLDRTNRADTPPSGNIPVIGAPPINPPDPAEKVAVKPPPASLAPGGTAARPAWVDAPPQLVDDVYQMAVVVGPYTTRQECDANLPEKIQEAVDQYVEVCLGPEEIDAVRLPAEYLRQQLVKDQWEEVRQHSIGPMTQLHVLLQFDRKVKDRVIEEHRQAVVAHRLWLTGAGLTAALGLLAAAFGYLKLTGFRGQGSEVRGQGSEEV